MPDSLLCPYCRSELAPGAERCPSCGRSQRHPRLELRHGTFLFCDLVESTRLINRLPPDAQLILMREMRGAVTDVLARYGGRIERFDGDAYFASFVGPDSREDDATMAVRAGLDIVQSVTAAGSRIGHDLRMRVGLASGAVLVGFREERAAVPDEGYIGAAVSLARRLTAVAPVQGVLIDDSTRRLAGSYFHYQETPRLTLRGFDEDVTAWTVSGISDLASRYRARTGTAAPGRPVGRETQLQALERLWQSTVGGAGHAALLHGEPGIGKSCLAHWLRSQVQSTPALVLELDCTPRTVHTPLYPLAVQLRRLANVGEGIEPQQAAQQVREWTSGLCGEASAQALQPHLPLLLRPGSDSGTASEQAMARATVAVAEWIGAVAKARPVLVLAEDLQWLDAATASLLAALAESCARQPLMLLGTSRSGHSPSDQIRFEMIDLPPLDAPESAALATRAMASAHPDEAAVQRVVEMAEGIPLYIEELALAMPPGSAAPVQPEAPLPATLATLIQARVDRWPALRPLVQTAAVLGRDFSFTQLLRLGEPAQLLPEAATRFVEEGLWERRAGAADEPWFRFRHALIHDAVYHTLLESDRRAVHSRVADLMRTEFAAEPWASPDLLGHHLGGAGRAQEAAQSYLEAATHAAARGAFADAAGHCRLGLQLAQRVSDAGVSRHLQRHLNTWLGTASAATRGYAAPEVEQAYQQARRLCEGDDDPAALFPIVRGLGTFAFVRARFADAHDIARECLDLAARSERPDQHIEATSFLGYTELYRGDPRAADEALNRCMAMYAAHDGARFTYPSPQDAGTSALALHGTVAWLRGDCRRAERLAAQALQHARRPRRGAVRPIDEAYALVFTAMQRNLQRRFGEALDLADGCIRISQEHGFGTWLAAATMQRCIAAAAAAPAPETLATLEYVLGEFKRGGAEANEPYFLWGVASGWVQCGDKRRAADAMARAFERAHLSGEAYLVAELHVLRAQLSADEELTRRELAAAFTLARAQGAALLALRAACAWAVQAGTPAALRSPLATAQAAIDSGGLNAPEDGWAERALADVAAWIGS